MPPSPTESPAYQLFVGVDIAAATVTAAWLPPGGRPGRPLTVDQTPAGYARLQQALAASGHTAATTLVAMEATGSYWMNLATVLARAGFVVAVINPAQAHHFAKALLQRAKSDAVDAQTLAQLAAALRPAPWSIPPAVYDELQQRLAQRDALLGMRLQATNQLHALRQHPVVVPAVQRRLEAVVALLTGQIAEVEAELAAALSQDAAWAAAAERLRSIPGVGLITAAWLLVATLNFTTCANAVEATAYAGLAPQPHQSGTSVRGRPHIGRTGHGRLRQALYLATLSACRYNPVLRAYYQRLRTAGKPMKVARCAAARKLLHLAWAVATKGRPFDPDYGQAPPVAVAAV